MLTLLIALAPVRVQREITLGGGSQKLDLKTALRCTLWVWNRSWVPMRFPVGTFFDIGWILSEQSCIKLHHRGFLRKRPLERAVDIAQLKLASIKAGFEASDSEKLKTIDRELITLVDTVFKEGKRHGEDRDASLTMANQEPDQQSPSSKGSGFDNSGTRKALLDFDDLCKNIGQQYFLVSGTLLGVVRDAAFIGHDHDIDLGVYEQALCEGLTPAIEASSVFAIRQIDRILLRKIDSGRVHYQEMPQPGVIQVLHECGVIIDLFVHFDEGDITWHGDRMHRWDNQRFELTEYEFLGRTFNGPKDFDLYLSENYGPDWRIPKVNFDSMLDTPNMTFVGTANGLVFWAWMVAKAVEDNDLARANAYLDMLHKLGVYPTN